jgi:hypothetical protein
MAGAPGRHGWVGGTGTAAHVTAATGARHDPAQPGLMTGPRPPELIREFWRYAPTN